MPSTPQTAMLQIVADAAPRETGIDRIERALAELAAKDAEKDPPTR